MLPIDTERLRVLAEKSTKGTWDVQYYHCHADRDDVKAKSAKKVGDILWSVAKRIGPIEPDHNHWSGNNLSIGPADAEYVAAVNPDTLLQLLDELDALRVKAGKSNAI